MINLKIECGSAFKANSALIDHRKRVHLRLKPHQCQYCSKDFFSKKDYAEHVRYAFLYAFKITNHAF